MMNQREKAKLRSFIFEGKDETPQEEKLLQDPAHMQFDETVIKQSLEEHIAKILTKEADLDFTSFEDTIKEMIGKVLEVHHVDIDLDNVDMTKVMDYIETKIVCNITDVHELIEHFTHPKEEVEETPEDEKKEVEEKNPDTKADVKKVEEPTETEDVSATTNEEYTRQVFTEHGRLIQEAINDYAAFSSKQEVLKEYCDATGLNYNKINKNKLFKRIYV